MTLHTFVNHSGGQAGNLAPSGDGFGLTVPGNFQIVAFVIRLLKDGRPSAILGGIRAFIVNAVNRVTVRRSWPHVLIEPLKRLTPFSADRNPSTAIARIVASVPVATSTQYGRPNAIFGRVRHAVRCVSFRSYSAIETSAASCAARQQMRLSNRFLLAARTLTQPIGFGLKAGWRRDAMKGRKVAESLLAQVFGHGPIVSFS